MKNVLFHKKKRLKLVSFPYYTVGDIHNTPALSLERNGQKRSSLFSLEWTDNKVINIILGFI